MNLQEAVPDDGLSGRDLANARMMIDATLVRLKTSTIIGSQTSTKRHTSVYA